MLKRQIITSKLGPGVKIILTIFIIVQESSNSSLRAGSISPWDFSPPRTLDSQHISWYCAVFWASSWRTLCRFWRARSVCQWCNQVCRKGWKAHCVQNCGRHKWLSVNWILISSMSSSQQNEIYISEYYFPNVPIIAEYIGIWYTYFPQKGTRKTPDFIL